MICQVFVMTSRRPDYVCVYLISLCHPYWQAGLRSSGLLVSISTNQLKPSCLLAFSSNRPLGSQTDSSHFQNADIICVHKCQNVNGCNPFKRWLGLFIDVLASFRNLIPAECFLQDTEDSGACGSFEVWVCVCGGGGSIEKICLGSPMGLPALSELMA